mmetsp:Transcript_11547/g.16470  ORF Transcript_11547/g.16470 Transcript_11547/m.16470 type:complete len:84 (+) Transcript_11547:94-345(+)
MHYRRSHCYQPHHMASKIPHRKNLADPEFIPRSLRLKIAMSAPSFMAESPVLTQQEEGPATSKDVHIEPQRTRQDLLPHLSPN